MLLISAFILGVASSFHCIGMCGPIAMALPLNRRTKGTQLIGLLWNNLGRIVTYAIIGLVIGSIGFSLQLYHFLQGLSIVVGALMIVVAWRKQLLRKIEFQAGFLQKWIVGNMGKLLASNSPFKLFLLGNLNGLLPCGMIFIAISTALLAENAVGSAAVMASFGLGTLPGMLLVGFFSQQISGPFRTNMSRAFPYIMTAVGALVMLRGANLGIPYLSPKIAATMTTNSVKAKDPQAYQIICHSPAKKK
jgi:sulfite exporter TauE/SafE